MKSKTLAMARKDVVDSVRIRVPPKTESSPLPMSVSILNEQIDCVHDCCYSRFLVQNYSNFKRSGPPARFMYYEDGSWADFSGDVVNSLRAGFAEGNAVVEVCICGNLNLFDLYRMLQVDFASGIQKSIAWMDVYGKFFFPKTFVDGGGELANVARDPKIEVVSVSQIPNVGEDLDSENLKIEIDIRMGGNFNSSKKRKVSLDIELEGCEKEKSVGSSPRVVKRSRLDSYCVESPRWPKAKLLKEGEKAYSVVKDLFISSVRRVEPGATITSIHQVMRSAPLDRARYNVFQKQMEITKAARGEAKITFGWHGTSAKGVASILRHGFAIPSKISPSEAHGVGVYLSPFCSPYISASLSEVDDNGEKHVILCRIIVGKCEKVESGSQQMFPSNVDFDTGVDDLKNPKWYIVWTANMNTHILPVCVVSYKPFDRVPGQLRGWSTVVNSVPVSSTVWAKLFSKLGSYLPSSRVEECRTLYTAYKRIIFIYLFWINCLDVLKIHLHFRRNRTFALLLE